MRRMACLALVLAVVAPAVATAQGRHHTSSSAPSTPAPPPTPGFGPNTGFGINTGFGSNTGFGPTTGFGPNTGFGPPVRSTPDQKLYNDCIVAGGSRDTCQYLATHDQ